MSYSSADWGANYFDATLGTPITYPFSVVTWVKIPNANPGWQTATLHYIWMMGQSFGTGASTEYYTRLYVTNANGGSLSGNTQGTAAQGNSSFTVDSLATTYNDEWIPVVVVQASATDHRIYVKDSSSVATSVNNKTLPDQDSLRIGRNIEFWGGFEGTAIAEVAIFDKELTNLEINQLWTSAETGPPVNTIAPSDCIAYWPLDTNGVLTDASGNGGPTLVETGSVTFEADHPDTSQVVSPPSNALKGSAVINLFNSGAWLDGPITASNLAGSTSLAFTATGDIDGIFLAQGSADIAFSASGNLSVRPTLKGAATIGFSATGNARTYSRLSGTATIEFGTPGKVYGYLDGTATIGFTATGELSGIDTPLYTTNIRWLDTYNVNTRFQDDADLQVQFQPDADITVRF